MIKNRCTYIPLILLILLFFSFNERGEEKHKGNDETNTITAMKAYIIVNVTVNDPVRYEDYKKMTAPTLQPFEGKFIVRGGVVETLEGDWQPGRLVVIEFPSKEKAKAWWSSDLYAPAKALRQATASTQMILVEGLN